MFPVNVCERAREIKSLQSRYAGKRNSQSTGVDFFQLYEKINTIRYYALQRQNGLEQFMRLGRVQNGPDNPNNFFFTLY